MRRHYDFSGAVRGKYAGKVDATDIRRLDSTGPMTSNDRLFVERRPEGGYAVRRPNAERASAVLPTQAEAIERARELNSGKASLVEHVRFTDHGSPDKWRTP
jgi:uncharacterized protein DUF2188